MTRLNADVLDSKQDSTHHSTSQFFLKQGILIDFHAWILFVPIVYLIKISHGSYYYIFYCNFYFWGGKGGAFI